MCRRHIKICNLTMFAESGPVDFHGKSKAQVCHKVHRSVTGARRADSAEYDKKIKKREIYEKIARAGSSLFFIDERTSEYRRTF